MNGQLASATLYAGEGYGDFGERGLAYGLERALRGMTLPGSNSRVSGWKRRYFLAWMPADPGLVHGAPGQGHADGIRRRNR